MDGDEDEDDGCDGVCDVVYDGVVDRGGDVVCDGGVMLYDREMDGRTFVVVESLSRLKNPSIS